MAVLEFGDTFDGYTKTVTDIFSTSQLSKKWTGQISADTADRWMVAYPGDTLVRPGVPTGQVLRCTTSANCHLYKTLSGGALATRCISTWWYSSTGQAALGAIIGFMDGTTDQLNISPDATAHLTVRRGTTVIATSTNTFAANSWYHIQFKATINNTTGAYEVKVGGTSVNWVPAATGANTRSTANNSATAAYCGQIFNGWMFRDFLVTDDFPGVVVGAYLRPAAAGNHQDWTASSGSNRGAVVGPFDTDASFVQSSTNGNIDTYTFEAVPSGGTPTIIGIQHQLWIKHDTGASHTVRPKIRASGTDYSGTSITTATSYSLITEASSVNPDTSSAWTKAAIEAAEFGYERVS